MPSPFQIGQSYRNREGQYTVILIDGTRMQVRYKDGHTSELDIASQARIWERIQEEDEFGAEDLDVDFTDGESGNSSRKTDEISVFVAEVLRTIAQPWPADITDQLCLRIQSNKKWLSYYEN